MFTGIIEEVGVISTVKKLHNGAYFTVKCKTALNDAKIGDSIAINGVCQTVTEIKGDSFVIFASYETLDLTTFSQFSSSTRVNLERALRLSDRLGGHIVSGHVDGKGTLSSIQNVGDAYKLTFKVPESFFGQIVKKGSITIDGISLTVAETENNELSIAIIPHTYENTTLKDLKIGSEVNIETDILAKYIEKLLQSSENKANINSNINNDFLVRNGFA